MGTLWGGYLIDGEALEAGGRGRNRTFNLSIKSRMLCQLSYASTECGLTDERQHGRRSTAFQNIAQPKLCLSRRLMDGDAAG